MKYKFLILIIAVCIFEVKSWPRRGGFLVLGLGSETDEDDPRNEKQAEDDDSPNRNSGNSRDRPGLGSLFDPTQFLPIREGTHALREGTEAFREGTHQAFREGSQAVREGTHHAVREGTHAFREGLHAIREGFNLPGRLIAMNPLFGGGRPNRPHHHAKPDSTSEKASSTTPSTTSSKPSSTTQKLETNPPEFTFKLPTDDKLDLSNKASSTTEKPGNGTDALNQRRLINAPDRCQDDALGNCREVF